MSFTLEWDGIGWGDSDVLVGIWVFEKKEKRRERLSPLYVLYMCIHGQEKHCCAGVVIHMG